jgi:hypothetical protein
MAEENSTIPSKFDNEDDGVTTTTVFGLALMEDVLMGRTEQNDLAEYSIELQDTWPVEEAIDEIASSAHGAHNIALAVLQAHRQNVIDGDKTSGEDHAKRMIDAVCSELRKFLKEEDIALSVLAGRLFVAGFLAAKNSSTNACVTGATA